MTDRLFLNNPCPCGSGKKFKRCCMGKTAARAAPSFFFGFKKWAVVALMALIFVSLVKLFQEARAYRHDNLSLYETRYTGLKRVLTGEKVVGYINDVFGKIPYFDAGIAEFFVTQYAMAPVLVKNDLSRERVIGNFSSGFDYASRAAQEGFLVEYDFGNGLVLLKRRQG